MDEWMDGLDGLDGHNTIFSASFSRKRRDPTYQRLRQHPRQCLDITTGGGAESAVKCGFVGIPWNLVVSINGSTTKSSIFIQFAFSIIPFWGYPHLSKPPY